LPGVVPATDREYPQMCWKPGKAARRETWSLQTDGSPFTISGYNILMTATYSSIPAPGTSVVTVRQLDHIVLRVKDPEAAVRWYVEKFGFLVHRLDEYRAGTVPFPSVEICPGQIIDLDGRKEATGKNLSHFAIEIDETDLIALKESGAFEVAEGPFRRWGARGPADLLYVDDLDGNTIELRHYGPSQVTPGA
jgi:catechol 2,3-dioxygenase-like lactoylglutathione lyase family enzyme